MELTQVNNSKQLDVSNLNFLRSQKVENSDLQPNQNRSNLDKVEYSNSIQSSFSLNVASSINTIAGLQTTKNQISTALKLVASFEKVVTQNSNSLDRVQPQIQNMITAFNSSVQPLNNNIGKIIDEQQSGESRIYFDGILGAKPISGQEIYEAISKQKQKLEQYNRALNTQLTETTTQAKEMFQAERASSTVKFEQKIDFEVESVAFEAKTIQGQSGSISQTQANAEPNTTKELLVAS